MDISKVDKNMAVASAVCRDGMRFFNVLEPPFRIYGVYHEGGRFRRLPMEVAEATNEGVCLLSTNTAGGRVRFVTDSPKIAIIAKRDGAAKTDNLTLINTSGFDIYSNANYIGTYHMGAVDRPEYEYILDIPVSDRGGVFNINMPDYGNVSELYVGICEGSALSAAPDYTHERPVVFYGSSITQGGCASRPGMAYEEILSRRLDFNYINLGFSGSARAERTISEYIRGLDMSVFVYDYDHNAPSTQHLEKTHERMFLEFREKNPETPVIMITAPHPRRTAAWERRAEIIRRTYDKAVSRGDRNVYFIDGASLFSEVGFEYTVDGTHPTDLGFWYMARGIEKVLAPLLEDAT